MIGLPYAEESMPIC